MVGGEVAPPAPAPGAATIGTAGEPVRARNPVQIQILNTEERSSMLKSFTVYIVHVSDFGRNYQIEHRFDEFAKLHADLVEFDPNLPPLPEKKMWASTDATTVAERRPIFEKILRHMLRSEKIVLGESQALWRFLEIPAAGMAAAQFAFKSSVRHKYAARCGLLVNPAHEKEHAYRLAHEAIIKTNLELLSSDKTASSSSGALPSEPAAAAAAGAKAEAPEANGRAADSERQGSPGAPAASDRAAKDPEAAVLEMLRWAVANGGERARRIFIEERGLAVLLNLLFKKGREEAAAAAPGQDLVPNAQVRTVLNALVRAEGDKYASVFADFLASGGVTILAGAKDVFQQSQAFSEFIAKLLWISWDVETQRAFLSGAHFGEALGLLSALFECVSRTARTCAGLLLSSLLSNQLLEGKEAQAAAGVWSLVEELVAASPAWTQASGGGAAAASAPAVAGAPGAPGAPGTAGDGDKGDAELAAFVQFLSSLAQSEDRMARILNCADAPWRLNDGTLPEEDCPLWAGCALSLWYLLKLRPSPERLAPLRLALPAVAEAAPARVRWLAGELLLMLQLQCPAQLGGSSQFGDIQAVVEQTHRESVALEAALREQVEHTRQGLRSELEHNQEVIASQRRLTEERQCNVRLCETAWHRPLADVLKKLSSTREKLSGSLTTAEARSERALSAVRDVLQLEFSGVGADVDERDLAVKLDGMREVEAAYLAKKQEFAICEEDQRQKDQFAEEANAAMERADKAVQETRRQIANLETKISSKQREVQSQRTLATSDVSALKGQLMAEMDTIKIKQAKLRERALKIQNSEPIDGKGTALDAVAAADEMKRIRKEVAQLKARDAELQAEQSRVNIDPATLEQQARDSEEAVRQLSYERDTLRESLHGLEMEHASAREVWQSAMTELQSSRQQRGVVERECSGLRQQLDSIWASWQPLHAKRLQVWRGRVLSLAQAQRGGRQLLEAVGSGWDGLRSERALRLEVLQVVQDLQGQLATLAQELVAVDDQMLED